ncbi:MAG: 2-C-methyl-D-erythritol 4-phosphate cytidylyltransferase [Planctomycetaceae bacterium]|nr:2-C-methyl-D-erythritol 4-phosphate cytidylyltransferase [Planctomycetaceae bacterium]
MSHSYAVLLAAAGKSRRLANDEAIGTASKKPFVELCGQPVWQHSMGLFAADRRVRQWIVILSPEDLAFFETTYSLRIAQWSMELVAGGAERFESIENGLRQVRRDIDFVAIHDAARPCVSAEQIDAVFRAAEQFDAAILASPMVGTIKRATLRNDATMDITTTVSRDDLWEAQTPQVFRRELIVDAFARRCSMCVTDDAQLVENIGHTVKIVPSDRTNLKITTASDLVLARQLLASREC